MRLAALLGLIEGQSSFHNCAEFLSDLEMGNIEVVGQPEEPVGSLLYQIAVLLPVG